MVIEKINLRSIASFSRICSYFDEGNQLVIDVMKAGVYSGKYTIIMYVKVGIVRYILYTV